MKSLRALASGQRPPYASISPGFAAPRPQAIDNVSTEDDYGTLIERAKGCVAKPGVNECFHCGIYSNGARKIPFGFRLQSLPEEKESSIGVCVRIIRIEFD